MGVMPFKMNTKKSLLAGVVASPLVAPAIWTMYSVFSPGSKFVGKYTVTDGIIFNGIFGGLFWLVSILLGAVILRILKKTVHYRVLAFMLLSTLCGSCVFVLIPLFASISGETVQLIGFLFFLGVGALFGLVTAVVFWLLGGITMHSSRPTSAAQIYVLK